VKRLNNHRIDDAPRARRKKEKTRIRDSFSEGMAAWKAGTLAPLINKTFASIAVVDPTTLMENSNQSGKIMFEVG